MCNFLQKLAEAKHMLIISAGSLSILSTSFFDNSDGKGPYYQTDRFSYARYNYAQAIELVLTLCH